VRPLETFNKENVMSTRKPKDLAAIKRAEEYADLPHFPGDFRYLPGARVYRIGCWAEGCDYWTDGTKTAVAKAVVNHCNSENAKEAAKSN